MATAKQIVGATAGGDKVEWAEYLGKLAVVEPLEHEHDIETKFGVTDAIRANVYFLLGPSRTDEVPDTLIFQNVMVSQFKRRIGQVVVGRVGQGENKKGNPPWLLLEPTQGDLDKAAKFWTARSLAPVSADIDREIEKEQRKQQPAPKQAPVEDEGWDDGGSGEDEPY